MAKRQAQPMMQTKPSGIAGQTGKRPRQAAVRAASSDNAVVSLRRGLEILRAFSPNDGPLSRHEIAQRTGLPNTTAARLIHTLLTLGYLTRVGTHSGYRPGPSILAIGHALIEALPFRRIARPLMQRLALDYNVWVTLGAADRGNMLVLEHVTSPRTPDIQVRPGSLLPMANTALGRAHFWAMTPEQQTEYLRELKRTGNTGRAKVARGFAAAVSELDRSGFCTALGTWKRDILEVATPIVIINDHPALALSCGNIKLATNARMLVEELGPALLRIATEIKNGLLQSGTLEEL